MLEQIKQKLSLSNYETNQLTCFDAAILKKAMQRLEMRGDLSNPFRYLLKAAEGIAADSTKQSAKALNTKEKGNQQREHSKFISLDENKLRQDAQYYTMQQLDKSIRSLKCCLAMAITNYAKYPTEQNEKWVNDYKRGLTKWETIAKFKQESNIGNESLQEQSDIQLQENLSTNLNVVGIL